MPQPSSSFKMRAYLGIASYGRQDKSRRVDQEQKAQADNDWPLNMKACMLFKALWMVKVGRLAGLSMVGLRKQSNLMTMSNVSKQSIYSDAELSVSQLY